VDGGAGRVELRSVCLIKIPKEFYFVVNIPQSFMTQYFLEKLSVTGKIYHPYDDAIEPEQIHLLKDGEKKLVYERVKLAIL
jgi:hypothetical protein